MNVKKLIRNVKMLIIFFTICFFSMIAYITYFSIYKSPKVIRDVSNPRIRAEEEETLRGSILDRRGEKLAYSEKLSDGKQKRVYAKGETFAHIIGYNSYLYGKTGIELAYNDSLQGTNYEGDILGVFFRGLKENINKDEKRGHDIYLTIDSKVQNTAYKMLGNDRGAVVAMNPKTGEVIALVSKPSYNPMFIDKDFDNLRKSEGRPFVNRATQGFYPPGSVFKIVTTAAVLENKAELKNEKFNCTGKLKLGDYILSCQGNRAHGKLNLEGAFKVSCNYTFGSIGIKLGYDNLQKTAESFMFNEKIKTADKKDVLNIRQGQIRIDDKKSSALIAQDAIGQHGVTANPMDMALVVSAIANKGVIMKPYVVSEIKDRYGVTINKTAPQKLKTAISSETAELIKKYMVSVVKSGTGKDARISGISIGGKTGSAENLKDKIAHSWFVALGPSEDPEIVVAVIVENAGKGGGRAAEIAREVIKAYLKK